MNSGHLHLSFYRFFPLGDAAALHQWRERLRSFCAEQQLKGTILLASEGVNVMVSGAAPAISTFRIYAAENFGITEAAFKEYPVTEAPFERMLIKIKKEIISVGDTELRPDRETAARLSPSELRQWLDEGRPMLLLDTRNDYEVEVGTFSGAQDLGITHSRDFAARAANHLDEWKDRPVVTLCTGGIRCEKASALLLKLGLRDVYQLDGGILRYLEENGAKHFDGNCFVFDWRLAVDGALKPTARSNEPGRDFGRHKS